MCWRSQGQESENCGDRERERETDRQTGIERETGERERQTDRQGERQTDRQRETGREREREADRQGERERDRDTTNVMLPLLAVVRGGVGLNVIACLLTIKCVALGLCVEGSGIRNREV